MKNGFILWQAERRKAGEPGRICHFRDDPSVVVDHCCSRRLVDSMTIAWKNVSEGILRPILRRRTCPGRRSSCFHPRPGEEKTIRLLIAWHVPKTSIRLGNDPKEKRKRRNARKENPAPAPADVCSWYAGKFRTSMRSPITGVSSTTFSGQKRNSSPTPSTA